MKAKLATARFFMERMLPETATHFARIQSGAGSVMELADETFYARAQTLPPRERNKSHDAIETFNRFQPSPLRNAAW
jgi:Acetyl-CoA dehydrogenase C-terminal like